MSNPSSGIPNLASLTPIDIISSALRLVGSLGTGEVPSASELKDAAIVLNDMLDAWNAERLSVYTVQRTINDQNGVPLSLTGGKQSYSLGNQIGTEDFFLPRPARLERVSIMYSASQQTPVELAMEMLDDVEWQAISNKSTPSILPQVCWDDGGFPDRNLSFWPIPTQANPVVLYPWGQLTSQSPTSWLADLQNPVSFPPGYSEAIRYNLALRLAAEFPGDMNKLPLVMKIAAESKARIQSINAPEKVAWVDPALAGTRPLGNIYTGSTARSRNF